MSVDWREITVLPSGFFFIVEIEDGHMVATVSRFDNDWEQSSHEADCHIVEGRLRSDSVAIEFPPCLGATFAGGGWADLLVCDLRDIELLGGFDAITEVRVVRF